MLIKLREHWPLAAGWGALWAIIIAFYTMSVRENDGHFIYQNDDIYIHMAIAKNVANHGVWGVTQHEFTSSSSSILYTLILRRHLKIK